MSVIRDELIHIDGDGKDRVGHGKPESSRKNRSGKLDRKDYEKALKKLQADLVQLQLWARETNSKICILLEGRDGAGKGGAIKAIMERTSPRVFRVVALPAPTDREKSQMYAQRYMPHLPAGGEIVIFDRSWYNRAGVERVMHFCTEDQAKAFLKMAPDFERVLIESGVILLKYWLDVTEEEQTRRIKARIADPRKIWKLSPMDVESYSRWYDYSRARDEMLAETDVPWAPWFVIQSDDKRRTRLNIISHILSSIPWKKSKRQVVELPKRQKPKGYEDPERQYRRVPEVY